MKPKFTNLIKFDFKFGHKELRRSIFAFRRGGFKFMGGSYLVGSDRVKFKTQKDEPLYSKIFLWRISSSTTVA